MITPYNLLFGFEHGTWRNVLGGEEHEVLATRRNASGRWASKGIESDAIIISFSSMFPIDAAT